MLAALIAATVACGSGWHYEFVPDVAHTVRVHRAPFALVGKLDAAGTFTETDRYVIGQGMFVHDRGRLLNVPRGRDRAAYELRAGVLTPGTLTAAGRFVPAVAGEPLPFASYVYSPVAPPIWNLPGYFRRVRSP